MNTSAFSSLPIPDTVAQAHSQELTQRLVDAATHAPLRFAGFMQRCLYEPGLGYYMAGSQKFGPDGDFVTAPEVSPLFGACLAEQCLEVLKLVGGGVMELGAGSGRLALSVIQHLQGELWEHYWIIEPSADLQDRQRALLRANLGRTQFQKIIWLDSLPEKFTGVVLANEVMDALPIDRIVRTDTGYELEVVQARAISTASSHVESPLMVARASASILSPDEQGLLDETLAHIEGDLGRRWHSGYCSEISQLLSPWIQSLGACLTQGALLLIDYGYPRREYYSEERIDGTLQCFYRHHVHSDATLWPGLQDITAHVDFTAVVEAGDAVGMELLGYTSQAAFLFGCGLQEMAASCSAVWGVDDTDSPASRILQQQALNRMTLPGEMGERFQVMALGRGVDASLKGFSLLDLSRRL